jgi:hypothetical protein
MRLAPPFDQGQWGPSRRPTVHPWIPLENLIDNEVLGLGLTVPKRAKKAKKRQPTILPIAPCSTCLLDKSFEEWMQVVSNERLGVVPDLQTEAGTWVNNGKP